MRRSGLSLDEEIAEVEGRLSQRRAQLRLIAAEMRSRVNMRSALPVALIGALVVGFAASRFVRRPQRPAGVPRSRPTRLFGTLAAALLPPLIRPLQLAIAQWLTQRMSRPRARPEPEAGAGS
jgi:hypothetical protein